MKVYFLAIFLFFSTLSFAHGPVDIHGESAELNSLFRDLAARDLTTHPLPPGSGAYVLLSDGSRYQLDSVFWRTALDLADGIAADLELKTDRDVESHGGLVRLNRSIRQAVIGLSKGSFWIQAGGEVSEFWTRHGPLTVVLIAVAELVEHSIPGMPPMCTVVQAGCVLWGQQLKFLWHSVWSERKSGASFKDRVSWSFLNLIYRYRYWRAMRFVFQGESPVRVFGNKNFKKYFVDDHDPVQALVAGTPFWFSLAKQAGYDGVSPEAIADELAGGDETPSSRLLTEKVFAWPSSSLQRYFAAQELTAFLDLQAAVMKSQLQPILKSNPRLYLKLRLSLAKYMKSVDRFDTVLKSLAMRMKTLDPSWAFAAARAETHAVRLQQFASHFEAALGQSSAAPGQAVTDLEGILAKNRCEERLLN